MAKTAGLPYQTVQFQYAASSMRHYMEDSTMTKEEKIAAIKEKRNSLFDMAIENSDFWIEQCEDGEFCKKVKIVKS